MSNPQLLLLLLRLGLAFSLFYAAISSFITPYNWVGYFPPFMKQVIPENFLLTGFSIYEILLGLWILTGKKSLFSGSLMAASMLGILIFNFNQMDVIFRDVTIMFAALALAASDLPTKKTL